MGALRAADNLARWAVVAVALAFFASIPLVGLVALAAVAVRLTLGVPLVP